MLTDLLRKTERKLEILCRYKVVFISKTSVGSKMIKGS